MRKSNKNYRSLGKFSNTFEKTVFSLSSPSHAKNRNQNQKYRNMDDRKKGIKFCITSDEKIKNTYFYSDKYGGNFENTGVLTVKYQIDNEDNLCLKNHIVFGKPVFPTDAFLELIIVACRSYFDIREFKFNTIVFMNPYIGKYKSTNDISVVFKKYNDGLSFEIVSNDNQDKVIHVRGSLQALNKQNVSYQKYTSKYIIDNPISIDVKNYYHDGNKFYFGEFYRSLKSLVFGSKHSIGKIEIDYQKEQYILNPVVVNAALANAMQYGPHCLEKTYEVGDDLFLPYKIEGLEIYGSLVGKSFVSLAELKSIDINWIDLYLEIVDENYKPIMIFESIKLRRVTPESYNFKKIILQQRSDKTRRKYSSPEKEVINQSDIAVIGVSCRFPQSQNIDEFWNVLKNGQDCITEIPEGRWDEYRDWYNSDIKSQHTSSSKWGGFIDNIDAFDPLFFNISPSEAEVIDPQQRIFLEESWRTIENAGISPETLTTQNCGVFVGCTTGDYERLLTLAGKETNGQSFMGMSSAILASRISYFLNLKGPAISIDTACSSSLTALHLACMSIRTGESDLALVGGISIFATPLAHILTSQVGMQSIDGRCCTFDNSANGTVFSEGCGVVLLKSLSKAIESGDNILGVIKGSGVNQDGKTNGITAPSSKSQESLIRNIYKKFNIDPESISYIEAHGTATPLGDPIEVQALTKAFQHSTSKTQYCAIGSVKSNIGHGSYAAGIAGFIKTLLCLKYNTLVPTLHFKNKNTIIDFDNSPFYVNTQCLDWSIPDTGNRLAAVSSFGFSGTNAHIVLGEYIKQEEHNNISLNSRHIEKTLVPAIIPLSAKNQECLYKMVSNLSTCIKENISQSTHDCGGLNYDKISQLTANSTMMRLEEVAYTLQVGRASLEERVVFVVKSFSDLLQKLDQFIQNNKNIDGCYHGNMKGNGAIISCFSDSHDFRELLKKWMREGMTWNYLNLWVNGMSVDWNYLYKNQIPNKVMLPSYPFLKNRYWVSKRNDDDLVSVQILDNEKNSNASIENVSNLTPIDSFKNIEECWVREELNEFPSANNKTVICFITDEKNQELLEIGVGNISPNTKIIFIYEGEKYRKFSDTRYSIISDDQDTYERALRHICHDIGEIDSIIYLQPMERSRNITVLDKYTRIIDTIISSKITVKHYLLVGYIQDEMDYYYFNQVNNRRKCYIPHLNSTKLSVLVFQQSAMNEPLSLEYVASKLMKVVNSDKSEYISIQNGTCFYRRNKSAPYHSQNTSPIKQHGRYIVICASKDFFDVIMHYLILSGAKDIIVFAPAIMHDHVNDILKELKNLGSQFQYKHLLLENKTKLIEIVERVVSDGQVLNGVFSLGHIYTAPAHINVKLELYSSILIRDESGFNYNWIKEMDNISNQLSLSLDMVCHIEPNNANNYFHNDKKTLKNDSNLLYLNPLVGISETQISCGKTIVIDWFNMDLFQLSSNMKIVADDLFLEQMNKIFNLFLKTPLGSSLIIIDNLFTDHTIEKEQSHTNETNNAYHVEDRLRSIELEEVIQQDLKLAIQKQLKIKLELLELDTPFSEYGYNSINIVEFAHNISNLYGIDMAPAVIFGHSTIGLLAGYLITVHHDKIIRSDVISDNQLDVKDQTLPDIDPKNRVTHRFNQLSTDSSMRNKKNTGSRRIAIIGMSGKFPKADNIDEFWHNLKTGRDCISRVSNSEWDRSRLTDIEHNSNSTNHATWGGFINDISKFDARFFNISDREAELMDPQQRLIMMYAYSALEDAGYQPASLSGKNIGVFIGMANSGYNNMSDLAESEIEALTATGLQPSMGPNRISYFLDLRGPSEPIETACSSSLIALRRGIAAINDGCEMAIVGGVNTLMSLKSNIAYEKAGMLSQDGKCKTFSLNADGFVRSEGIGILILKKQKDAERDGDNIHGIVCGSAENHGGRALALTTPNPIAHTQLLERVYKEANINPRTVSYVETHGTGTQLGDSIELEGLKNGFSSVIENFDRKENSNLKKNTFCGLGSVKTNIGHTEIASGVIGIIKVLLQFKYRTLVSTRNTDPINPYLQIEASPFYIVEHEREWKTQLDIDGKPLPRRAGVSAFGMGGVNAHVVLEEYNTEENNEALDKTKQLIIFSARTVAELINHVSQMLSYVDKEQALILKNFAYTLQIGRDPLEFRVAMTTSSQEELTRKMKKFLRHGEKNDSINELYSTNIYSSDKKSINHSKTNEESLLDDLINSKDLDALGLYWVQGGEVTWDILHEGLFLKRLSLPTYPFSCQHYWVSGSSHDKSSYKSRSKDIEFTSNNVEKEITNKRPSSPLFESWFTTTH